MPFCGPKLSLCGVVLSAWGIVQLSLMGIFFYIRRYTITYYLLLKDGAFVDVQLLYILYYFLHLKYSNIHIIITQLHQSIAASD